MDALLPCWSSPKKRWRFSAQARRQASIRCVLLRRDRPAVLELPAFSASVVHRDQRRPARRILSRGEHAARWPLPAIRSWRRRRWSAASDPDGRHAGISVEHLNGGRLIALARRRGSDGAAPSPDPGQPCAGRPPGSGPAPAPRCRGEVGELLGLQRQELVAGLGRLKRAGRGLARATSADICVRLVSRLPTTAPARAWHPGRPPASSASGSARRRSAAG